IDSTNCSRGRAARHPGPATLTVPSRYGACTPHQRMRKWTLMVAALLLPGGLFVLFAAWLALRSASGRKLAMRVRGWLPRAVSHPSHPDHPIQLDQPGHLDPPSHFDPPSQDALFDAAQAVPL